MYFKYGETETDYLSKKDKKLAYAISAIGHINRDLDEDLFSSVIHHIIGQQISVSAQRTVWRRMRELLGTIDAISILKVDDNALQQCGMTFRKVEYIKNFSQSVMDKQLILEELPTLSDEEIIKKLSSIKGIGIWTGEMIMTFAMERPDVISYGDLAILRGMRMLYRHRKITPELFNKYKKRYSPYGTTAALYLWAIAGGAIPELTDPEVKKSSKKPTAKGKV